MKKTKTGKPGPEAKDEITKPRQSNPKGYLGGSVCTITGLATANLRYRHSSFQDPSPVTLQCTEQVFWGGRPGDLCHGRPR